MATTFHPQSQQAGAHLHNRRYIYYSRYPATTPSLSTFSWRKTFRVIWLYIRLFIVTIMMSFLGAALPILIASEFFFKPLLANDCDKCLVIGAQPYFELDLISASFMAVMGFILPLLTVLLLFKILRSAEIRRELLN